MSWMGFYQPYTADLAKEGRRRRAIVGHLRAQRLDVVELALLAQPLDERQAQRLVVEIAAAIQQVRLDRDRTAVADRRPDADARHGAILKPAHDGNRRVDAVAPAAARWTWLEIGGGKPERRGRGRRRGPPCRRRSSDGRAARPLRRRGPRRPDAECACSRRRSPCSARARSSRCETRDPRRARASSVNVPERSRPNRKFAPTQTSATRSQSMMTVSTNSSGSQRESSCVNRTIATPCMPARSKPSSFWSSVMSSGGALSGRRTRGGCGSKMTATGVPPRSPASRRTRSSSFR